MKRDEDALRNAPPAAQKTSRRDALTRDADLNEGAAAPARRRRRAARRGAQASASFVDEESTVPGPRSWSF